MQANAVLSKLEKKGKTNTEKIYRNHGVTGTCFGVSYADITAFTKSIQTDHALSLQLWESGVHDARVLATKVADASKLKETDLEKWIRRVDNYILDDAVASLASRSKVAHVIAKKWTRSPDEWRAAAGWSVVAILALDGRLPLAVAKTLLLRIERTVHQAKNRARHSMNNALIAIGGSLESLREPALEVAKSIGKVEVDHGQTGCKTPDAARYIQKMVDRAARPTRVRGARSASTTQRVVEKQAPPSRSKPARPKPAKKVVARSSRASVKKPPPKRK
jgi:3-methyladenine DNA glycosylase AlkD